MVVFNRKVGRRRFMAEFFKWFTGGAYYHYHTLVHCMDYDYVTLTIVLILCAGVFTGYLAIAWQWSRSAKKAPDSSAKRALQDLKWIFIICAVCGYLWVFLELFWPAWRFYMIFLALLNLFTWRYVLRNNMMNKVYDCLKDRSDLISEIEEQRKEIDKLSQFK